MGKILLSILMLSTSFQLALTALSAEEKSDSKKDAIPDVLAIKGGKLTLEQAIQLALERNHDLLSTRLDAAMSDSQSLQYQAKYDIYLNAAAGIEYEKVPKAQWAGNNYKDRTSYTAGGSISKSFSTGTTFSAGMNQTKSTMSIVRQDAAGNYIDSGDRTSYVPVAFAT
ncbi:MAG TPA: hypothetical protein PKK43_14580, partial [Spirochaetota bacterium]|nr:hypothetical protein [Spirochaetota bacterium]